MKAPSANLGSTCTFLNGGTPAKSEERYFTGNIPWITSADIDGRSVSSVRSFITEEAVQESATNLVPAGTVLLVTRTGVGKVAIAESPLCFSQDITALIPNPKVLDPRYLAHFLSTHQSYFERIARGATIKGITRDGVASLEIPLPPLAEQLRIADILDRAAVLRVKRAESAAVVDELDRSLFLETFGTPRPEWPVRTVAEMVDGAAGIRTGPFGSQLLHSEFVSSGVAVLGIDNAVANEFRWGVPRFITAEKYEKLRRYTVKSGDVLITIMGTCGRCAIVPEGVPVAINTKHLCCITLNQTVCLPQYLHAYFLMHPVARAYLAREAKGAIMSGLNMGIIKALPVHLPPIDLQQEFVRRRETIAALKRDHQSGSAVAESLFASLQHRAFRGEL